MDGLEGLKKDFIEFKMSIVEYIAGLKEWQKTTVEYRKQSCEKLDKIFERLDTLPCKERAGWYQSLSRQVSLLWVFISGIIIAVILEWIRKR
jgi:hypothetical protein